MNKHIGEPMKSLTAKKAFKLKLLKARREINNPKRSGNDNFKKRKYVTLQDLYDVVIPALLEEGLILSNYKSFLDSKLVLITKIEDCESDEYISTFAILNESLKIQEHGAELTYHSRYNLGCLLSIRTDFDDDAESIKDKEIKNNKLNEKQIKEIAEILNGDKKAWNLLKEKFGYEKVSAISQDKYDSIITFLNIYNINKENKNEI